MLPHVGIFTKALSRTLQVRQRQIHCTIHFIALFISLHYSLQYRAATLCRVAGCGRSGYGLLSGQDEEAMMTNDESKTIWDLIKNIEVAMLTTEREGQLRARPMYQVQDKFDGTIWFLTSEKSAKAEELQENQQVCLAYCDPAKGTFVSISGSAGFNKDETLINKFWNESVKKWVDGNGGSDDVTLLEVYVEQAEVWDTETSTMKYLFEIAKFKVTDSEPEFSGHRKYG